MNQSWLVDGPENSEHCFMFTHGAGAPMDSPFMNSIAKGLANEGFRVARFEFPYMQERRRSGSRRPPNPMPVLLQAWRDCIRELNNDGRWLIGGKSMGGRVASMVADELDVKGLVCLGYPLHPPGRPEKLRASHLANLKTPTLMVQGERDPMGTRADFKTVELSPTISFAWLADGDHSFKPRKKSGWTPEGHLRRAIDAVVAFAKQL